MKELPDLKNLSPEEKDALIIRLWEELLKLRKQVEELQAKQKQPKSASVPVGLEPGSPFGKSLEVLITYLRYHHALSYQRLSQVMSEVFQVEISEGAIANLLTRVKETLSNPVSRILERLQQSRLVCSVKQYCARLRGMLREVLNLKPKQSDGQRLLKRYQQIRDHLLVFLEDETVPPTNNSSEQALRWSVVFRKVTHGFRSSWGADLFAQVRSVINTGKRQGMSAFEAISAAIISPHTFGLGS